MVEEIDLYLRKSKVVRDQEKRDLTSVGTQEELGRRWAVANNYRVRHVWVDNLSAWSDIVRPEFDGALNAILLGEVKALWCFAMDRFTRKGVDEIGPVLGRARVVFDYEGLDSSNERDRQWIINRAEQAREYSLRLSYNIRTTKEFQRSRGMWLGDAPYGLKVDGPLTRKLKHSADWPTVERIVGMIAAGTSGRQTCIVLNDEGVPSPNGGRWQSSTVSRMLNNPVYEGWQVTNQRGAPGNGTVYRNAEGQRVGVLAEGSDPIPSDLLAKARSVLSGHLPIKPVRKGQPRTVHVLTGLTRCTGCLGALPCEGRSHVCSAHKIGKGCPRPTSVMRTALELYVRNRWVSRLSAAEDDDPLLPAVAERYGALQDPRTTAEAREAWAAVEAAERGVERLVQQMAAGMYEPPFDAHLPALQAEARAALLVAKARAAKAAPSVVDLTLLREAETAQQMWDSADVALRRDLARVAIQRIYVSKAAGHCKGFDGDSRVTIVWHGEADPMIRTAPASQ
ncbi:recombinase family protein [Streptomyces sp. SL13]|uniref:Recombinase family protein n=1 Tax=Streptantibioticus silvisoli TaxID=2705255 RepID=A0AA90H6K4_9ACTN|nr:recombinase family protein [Streptantibioticus silvisoli]MDI5969725.1 recombinase family protein [Streptantibioticus silvisoli]